ncbi:hypothetical protein F7D01_13690 [Erythrobacter sp. 3-20A1M]|uniref:hypothetical protein n=1 Tax=Erythrobacter sp. 3-20A1M TaxID=2653850 RepID=UPI001BFCD3FE|nr:hypothetical protein [Erythrobacter sp. 3-20A1M]QWC57974.1 hypothetical protein F7D01_13690 [Erythrobacter sp. 3-20A1M]
MQQMTRPNYLKATLASMAASAILIAAPFAVPFIPLWPFIILNWLLFMSVGYFVFFRPCRLKAFVEQPDRRKLIAFNFAFLTFTIAGWVAILNAERIV